MGDSKTAANSWPNLALVGQVGIFINNAAIPSTTVQLAVDDLTARLAALSSEPSYVLMNWGVNEMGALPSEATWENNYWTIIDAVHTKWPNAPIYITRPWKRNFDAEATTLHGWIDTIVAARSPYTRVFDDEAVWLKGGDNGVTNTTDGIHYSSAGQTAKAAQVQTILGFHP